MMKLEQFMSGTEVCDGFSYEPNISSMDFKEMSCITCKNWDGEKCCLTTQTVVHSTD